MNNKTIAFLGIFLLLTPAVCVAGATTLDVGLWLKAQDDDSLSSRYQAYHVSRKTHHISKSPFQSMDINYDGVIRVSNDDRSIKSISPGGYLKISIRTFGNSRKLLVNSDSRGKLSYEFRVGRQEVPFEPEGRRWLEDVLIQVVRSSGLDAEGRAQRFYSNGGLDAFLDELSQIHSNNVKSRYFSALLDNNELSNRELSDVAYSIAGKLSSNTDRGRLFRSYQNLFLRDNQVASAYFSAISKLSSSTEKGRIYRNIDRKINFSHTGLRDAYFTSIDRISSNTEAGSVLRYTLANQDLPAGAQAALLRSVTKISSNSESGRVLRSGNFSLELTEVCEAYFSAVDNLSSSSEAGSTLRHVLSENQPGGACMTSLLSVTKKISSDSEKSSVIRSINKINLGDPVTREAYFNVIRLTSSDTEAGRMMRYTLEKHAPGPASMINLFETNGRRSSNTEISYVLRASVPHLVYEGPVLEAFFTCTNKLSSSTEHGRVLRELAKSSGDSREVLTGILYSAQKISSSSEKGSVLRSVAPKVKESDKEMKDLYMESARTLSSDSEFRRVMDAIM